jgi:hypothetical protein
MEKFQKKKLKNRESKKNTQKGKLQSCKITQKVNTTIGPT